MRDAKVTQAYEVTNQVQRIWWRNTRPNSKFGRTLRHELKVMYTYIMQRTQISLTTEERRALDEESERTGKSLSALVREAVEKIYGSSRSSADDLELMRQSFGSWSEREEDGAAFVERLRSGSRIISREK